MGDGQTPLTDSATELNARCNAIEESYEFMLAYAAQGLPSDEGSSAGRQVREYLHRCDGALTGLADFLHRFVAQLAVEPAQAYHDFIDVLGRDVVEAQAAVQLVLAQPSISSQIVDNLNASIHLRAVLTDLFLVDEILKSHRQVKT